MSSHKAPTATAPREWFGRAIVIIVAVLVGVGVYHVAGALGAADSVQSLVAFVIPALVVEAGWIYRRKRGW